MNKPSYKVLYGGTFNPIHLGHLKPVASIANEINVTELIYIPCHIPPHKAQPDLPSELRLALTEQAIQNFPFPFPVSTSDYEIKRADTSYTLNTVEHYAASEPNSQLAILIGLDSLLNFTKWYKWQEILELCQILVMLRPGYNLNVDELDPEIRPFINNKISILNTEEVDISSSEIRENIKELSTTPSSLRDFDAEQTFKLCRSTWSVIKSKKLYK